MRGYELFAALQQGLGPEAERHRGVDAPARRDTAIAGGSYRAPGSLVDGFRAGDSDAVVTGIVVTPRASTAVIRRAIELKANVVISRQAFLGDSQDRPVAKPEPALAEKLALIESARIAVLRFQDPRTGPAGRAIAQALPEAIGLRGPLRGLSMGRGLVYRSAPVAVGTLARRIGSALPSTTMRLVGDPALMATGIAFAIETSRPNALSPLIARPDVNLLVAGEVHETETTAYVLDAIAMGQRKALLLTGSIAAEQPAARALTAWLSAHVAIPVTYVDAPEALRDVA